ncbi:S-layer homology domain-containing protein [Brachybacterium nesterenkovii]|uniref:SLH domain-containing protein n=1 Tax=Brachybacterium nesterenkovii TaxID=47847 RepID=A0A1X6X9G8_9MICO|nr:S-layer homology domain-containing protein [Brachybacterium nesterenkovii]SLM95858.1 hypothetical protein FM110_13520 [Brachybacterium nesterenkovii]
MSPSHPVRPLPSVRRRVLLGLGAAAVPAAVLGLPEVADAVPAGPGAPAEPVLPLEPVDPAVTGGETVILDQVLADLAPVTDDPDGPLRRIEDVAATMIGCTWQGEAPEEVWVRGRAEDGTWSPWLEAERAFDPETGDAADGTEPSWLGGSFAVDVRASRGGEDVSGELTAHIVTTSPRKQDDGTALFTAGAGVGATGRVGVVGAISSTAGTSIGPNAPTVISRAQWGADESLVRSVSTSSSLKGVVLHHTAGANSYSQAESAQQVRGILSYHTKTLGWSDIGYNFLIDRYGQVFEARHGGMINNVVGAHALGFNTGTCGISVMGDFTSSAPPQVAIDAAMSVAAWKLLGTMRADISEKVSYTVGISGTRFPKGSTQSLPRFYAHRDVGTTACPGAAFYGRMSTMRTDLQRRIDTGWRGHFDAFRTAGGGDVLGSVKKVAHPKGSYTLTVLTKGIILSDGLKNSVAYATPFADSWKPEWGRPTSEASEVSGVTRQRFEHGTAVLQGGNVTFSTQRFSDVPPSMMFAAEIEEIAARGITTGYPDGTYRPAASINRDAMIAFIHRAKGSPSSTPPARSPFRDLTPSTMYYKEICWALDQGITTGYPDGTYRPTEPVERGAVAAFLHRCAGSPTVSTGGQRFSDVPVSHQFFREISWLVSAGITTGWPDGTFHPEAAINRDAMAAFMVRWLKATGA